MKLIHIAFACSVKQVLHSHTHTYILAFQHGSRPSKNIGSAVHVNFVLCEAKAQIKLLAHVTKHIPHSGQIADREAAVNGHRAQLG